MGSPPAQHLGELIRRAAERWPERTAWVFDQPREARTFVQVEQQTNQIANGLIERGVRPGDAVAILLPNVIEWPLAWLGVAKAGAFTVPINVRYRRQDAGHLLGHSRAAAVITDAVRYPKLGSLVSRLEDELPSLKWSFSAPELLEGSSINPPDVVLTGDALVNVQYTSGTTGMPKGCMLTHRYFTRFAQVASEDIVSLDSSDVMLTAQPFSYLDPQWNVAAGMHCGATVVVLDGFHPSSFWQKCTEHRATFFYCLGAMPTLLLAVPPTPWERAHQVRFVSCSAIPQKRHAELEQRFGTPWHEMYGSTECGPDIAVTAEMHDVMVASGALGRALPHREVVIIDESGDVVERGEVGQLAVRGLGMFDGYFENPEATSAALVDGWYRTGDLATMENDDVVSFVGRTKDMIRRGGENIAALEVEQAIQSHPHVKLAACVAVPDDLRQEEVKVFVVPREGIDDLDLDAVARHTGELLASFKVPRYWEIRGELPMTPSERVAKHRLLQEPPLATWDRNAE